MKILLINPYCYPEVSAGKLNKFLTPMPPIGMAYLLAAIEESCHTPLFHDDLLAGGDDEKLTKILLEFRPQIVGIPVYSSPVVYRFQEIVKLIRKILPEAYIQSGNLHANYFAREMLREQDVDIVVKGEGETTICEIADVLAKGGTLAEVKGIIFRDQKGEIIETENRPYNCDLDRLAFPAWHLMPYRKYNINELGKIASTGTFVLGSRGCPFGCEFCSLLIQGRKRRVRSKENICAEIEWLIEKFNYKSFHFIDPTWPISKAEGMAFAQEMIKRGLHKKIIWGTETRLDIVDEELLAELYKAGCRKVMYGIESGSQLILDQVNKKNDLQKVRQVIAWSHKHKLSPAGFFIMGLPGETSADIEKTIELALSLKLHFAKFSGFVPYPGTPLYEKLLAEKALPVAKLKDWNSYTSYPSLENPPIYVDKHLELAELIALQKKAHLKFYLRPKQILYVLAVLRYSFKSFFFAGVYLLSEIFNLLRRKLNPDE